MKAISQIEKSFKEEHTAVHLIDLSLLAVQYSKIKG